MISSLQHFVEIFVIAPIAPPKAPATEGVVVPRIRGPGGLPMLDPETKKVPANIASDFGDYIHHGHGFAQVFPSSSC